jgi:Endonuclease/Exonuclease/phosphatase family
MTTRRVAAVGLSLCAVVGAAVLVAWASGVGPFADDEEPTTLKVMTFNIFYGGDDYDLTTGDFCATSNGCPATFTKVVEAIRSSGADIVGLEEGEANTVNVAKRLGWYASPRTQIVSRYPLLDPPDADGTYVLVEVKPGKVVAMSSIHLPSTPYGPYAVRDGASAEKVLALEEKTRVPALTARLRSLDGVMKAGMPVFLVGDFNSPSQLDWTDAAAAKRDEVPYPLAWPAGALAEKAGFRDSYREAYPDPVAKPGFTWTPGGPEDVKNEVHDRIDWVLVSGPAKTVTSQIMGEKAYADTDIAVDPFPSDHRGLVSTFSVEPAATPILISVHDRDISVGEDVHLAFSALGEDGERIVIVPAGTSGEPTGEQSTGGLAQGELTLPTAGLEPGAKEALLLGADDKELARSPFWLYPPDAPTSVTTTKPTFAAGEPITVHFSNTPGNRWDWIGLFKATAKDVPTDGSIPDDSGNYLLYVYTQTEIEGDATFTSDAFTGSGKWPLPPGRYEARVMVDDGYQTIARSAPFVIEP